MQVQTVQNQYNFTGQVYSISIPSPSKQMNMAIKHLDRMNKLRKSEANVYIVPGSQKHNIYIYATNNPIPTDPNKLPLLTYWDMTKYGEKASSNNRTSIIKATKRTLRKYKENNHFNEFLQKYRTTIEQQKTKDNITQKIKNFINNIFN